MNIIKLYQDHNIPYATDGPNCSPGWVVINCPHCDDPSMHLGYSLKENYFRCWRCGWKPINKTIAKLLNTNEGSVVPIISRYGGEAPRLKESVVRVGDKPFRYPSGIFPKLQNNHRQYLKSRGFDSDYLERLWSLQGTGPVSTLDGIDYKNRIIVPIHWDGRIVSFQGRTVGKGIPKYRACPQDREIIPHKTILYGKQGSWSGTGICVEGVTDVWRLGSFAFATFGTTVTLAQIQQMSRYFKKVAVALDPDSSGNNAAESLIGELHLRGVKAWRAELDKDPGSMNREEAQVFVRHQLSI